MQANDRALAGRRYQCRHTSRHADAERLRHAITDFTKVVLHRQPNIAIYFARKRTSPEALAEINALRRQFDHVLSDLLVEGMAAGEFEIQDHSLAALALGGMISWAYTWYQPGGR